MEAGTILPLLKRETRKYVDQYRHLDKETEVGDLMIQQASETEWKDYDRGSSTMVVTVCSDLPNEELDEALRNTLGHSGCSCSYDCCGCESIYVREIELIGVNQYRITRSHIKNY